MAHLKTHSVEEKLIKPMNTTLCEIAEIRPGHPFRGTIAPVVDSNTYVVQVRDTDTSGEIRTDEMITTELTGRKQPDWLQQGDILFVAKGAKHFAACVKQLPVQTVCSPHFFIVRIKTENTATVLPEFISWQLNQIPAQRYFKTTAEGSMYVSIRRQVLEDVPITLPSIEKQAQLVALHASAVKEQKMLQKLITNRQQLLDAIALDILTN
ncbi:restriction endonuclease subunit S [Alkalimarinus alittae]|uniref:Restriction endonuclease subunit S n=1 Tax=Alkalimarinus alittae TaxID=2961619 RepID=A0ABY6N677_9ALTE|nr:restriction endonuclease subunit S [Alkalimarinus alittae]UZE97631.1 restriction endonuclease subunit S [Alkalimarinus alittae]